VAVNPRQRPLDDCNAQLVNGVRGRLEAQDAIRRTAGEGFPRGATIFLDIEYMQATPSRMRDYYRAWTREVLRDGRYRPGFYAHTRNAALIHKDVAVEYAKAGVAGEPPFWIANESDSFSPERVPTDVGHAFAAMWQGTLDIVEQWSGKSLPIDVNVAETPDPSHQFVTEASLVP
jgi:GH25 family lysozyme M1 (1,4-beta-N-acetylmuramidase)